MTDLTIGETAPGFSLLDSRGKQVRLSDYRGKNKLLLVFYPKDKTPGCTRQLCAVRDDIATFAQLDVVPFGVNPASAKSHQGFIDAYHFPFEILIDEGAKVAETYGALKEDTKSINRTVVVVDQDGRVVYYVHGLPPDSEIIAAIKKAD